MKILREVKCSERLPLVTEYNCYYTDKGELALKGDTWDEIWETYQPVVQPTVWYEEIEVNNYVELSYPVINWTDETINPDIIFGTIGIFNIIQIHKTKLKGYENEWSFQRPDNGNVFEGTLSECKQQINKLLYNF